jgi:xanthine dehydrogenase FAD-binding subunit
MAIAHEFEYARPKTLGEAVQALARAGGKAVPLAGGTDLVGWMRDELVSPGIVVDLKGIDGLSEISVKDDAVEIGALVTFGDLLRSEVIAGRVPLLREAAGHVACTGIRNRATMVGNICSAVPSCDAGPPLLVHEGTVEVAGTEGERSVPITCWFEGPRRAAIREGEIATRLVVPIPAAPHGGCYVKLGRYRGEDLAQASVAVLALPDGEWRVAFGAVAPTPVRAPAIEEFLRGSSADPASLEQAVGLIADATAPITDIRATREYRAHMLGVMFRRAVVAAAARRDGRGAPYGERFI